MTVFKAFICLNLSLSLISCNKDDDDKPEGFNVTSIGSGVSLKADSPYASELPYFASCGSTNATIAASCPASRVPFIGDRGLPMTRELIKEHALAGSDTEKESLDRYIESLPNELLPFFAKIKLVSSSVIMPTEMNKAAEYGVLSLSPFFGKNCEDSPSICADTPKSLPEWGNMIYGYVAKDTAHRINAIEWANHSNVLYYLCNAADAYATHDFTALNSRMDATGKIKLARFSESKGYPYTINQDLDAYWANIRKDSDKRMVIDHKRLMAGIDDASASALNSLLGYSSATGDFIATCQSYLLLKAFDLKSAAIVLDTKTGEIQKTKKNQLGDQTVKAKLEKMLPILFADPAEYTNGLASFPPSEELSKEETDRILVRFKFN